MSGLGLNVRRLLELVPRLPVELVLRRQNTRRHSWPLGARKLVLLPLCLLVWPAFSRATADEAAVPPTAPIEFAVQTGHTAEIQGLEYASNGKFFVSAGKDSTIKLWSPAGTLIRTIRTGFWVNYLALSHDGQLLLAASRTGTIFLLSLDGRVVHRFPDIPMREGFVSAVAISSDNHNVAIGATRGLVLYRLEGTTDTRVPTEGDTSEVESVIYGGQGPISGSFDGKLRFWSNEGKLVHAVPAHEYAIKTLALSPDGKTLATAGSPILFGEVPKNIKPVTKLWGLDGNPLGQFSSPF